MHSSKNLQSIPRSKFSYSEDFVDNERLEWVGDALLRVMHDLETRSQANEDVPQLLYRRGVSISHLPKASRQLSQLDPATARPELDVSQVCDFVQHAGSP